MLLTCVLYVRGWVGACAVMKDHHAGQRDGEDVAPRGMDEEEGETLASYSGGMFRFGAPSYDSLSDDDSEDDSD